MADDGSPSGPASIVTTPTVQATPYDGLHSLVHWGVAPWFDSYVNSKQSLIDGAASSKKGGEAQMGTSSPCYHALIGPGIPVTKKKFAELELSLLHLKQNVEIPDAHLSVHPVVRKAIAQVCNRIEA